MFLPPQPDLSGGNLPSLPFGGPAHVCAIPHDPVLPRWVEFLWQSWWGKMHWLMAFT